MATRTTVEMLIIGDNRERIYSEAAFAKLCGARPIPASSEKANRYRLNRGGNRHANAALHCVVITRMRSHEPTLIYMRREQAEEKTKAEIVRCLKRYVARRILDICAPDRPCSLHPLVHLNRHRSIQSYEHSQRSRPDPALPHLFAKRIMHGSQAVRCRRRNAYQPPRERGHTPEPVLHRIASPVPDHSIVWTGNIALNMSSVTCFGRRYLPREMATS